MPQVFISYSRKDQAFAQRLLEKLETEKINGILDVKGWIDWEDIPVSVDWEKEIFQGINKSDAFICIVTPAYIKSQICNRELGRAIADSKQIIPIMRREVRINGHFVAEIREALDDKSWANDAESNEIALSKINYLLIRKNDGFDCEYDEITRKVINPECDGVESDADDFEASFRKLIGILEEDPLNTSIHTRLTVRAREWQEHQENKSYLLRGKDLQSAENWQISVAVEDKKPKAGSLVLEYLAESRKSERTAQRNLLISVSIALFVVTILALLSFAFYNQSQTNLTLANNNAATANAESIQRESQRLGALAQSVGDGITHNTEVGALLAIQGLRTAYSFEADIALNSLVEQLYTTARFIVSGNTYNSYGYETRSAEVQRAVILPDNQTVLLVDFDGNLHRYNIQDGKETFTTNLAVIGTNSSFSRDGGRLLIDNQLFDTQHVSVIATPKSENATSFGSFLSPNGNFIATPTLNGGKQLIDIWDLSTNTHKNIPSGCNDYAQGVAFIGNGEQIAFVCDDRAVWFWNEKATSEIYPPNNRISQVIVTSSRFNQQLGVTQNNVLLVWNNDLNTTPEVTTYDDNITCLDFSPDGSKYVVGTQNGIIELVDINTKNVLRRYDGNCSVAAFSLDNNSILTTYKSEVRIRDARLGISTRRFEGHGGVVNAAALSPDNRLLLTNGYQSGTFLWDVESGKQILQLPSDNSRITSIAFSPNGKFAVTGSNDANVRIWEIPSGKLIRTLRGWLWINDVAISPDSKRIVAAGGDRETSWWEWDANTGDLILGNLPTTYINPNPAVNVVARKRLRRANLFPTYNPADSVAFSPDGQIIIVGNSDGKVSVYDSQTGDAKTVFDAYQRTAVTSVDISPDNGSLLTSGSDGNTRIWDATGSIILQEFQETDGGVSGAEFSPDGQYVVTASSGGTGHIWRLDDGREMRRFISNDGGFSSASFSNDGRYVLMTTGSIDNTNILGIARIEDSDYHNMIAYVCTKLFRDLSPAERRAYSILHSEPTCPEYGPHANFSLTETPLVMTISPQITLPAISATKIAHLHNLDTEITALFPNATRKYGPTRRSLPPFIPDVLSTDIGTGVTESNFVLQTVEINPKYKTDGDWDFGIHFGKYYWLVLTSYQRWGFLSGVAGPAKLLQKGDVPDFVTNIGGSNLVRLITYDNKATLTVNGNKVAEVDLSAYPDYSASFPYIRLESGITVHGMDGGNPVGYEDLIIWVMPS